VLSFFLIQLSVQFVAVVVARAIVTSQSADAHCILFQRIFAIAEADTALPVQFSYLHGTGIDSVTADGHRGQGLGTYICIFSLFSMTDL
jgi:hypothetical protein